LQVARIRVMPIVAQLTVDPGTYASLVDADPHLVQMPARGVVGPLVRMIPARDAARAPGVVVRYGDLPLCPRDSEVTLVASPDADELVRRVVFVIERALREFHPVAQEQLADAGRGVLAAGAVR